jgi:HlyD family secretion protein
MKRKLMRWATVMVILSGIAFLIWQKTRPTPIEVLVKPVTRGVVEKTVANTRAGTIKACRRAKLSPSIGGQISRLLIREGNHVKAGDLLVEVWNEDLSAQLALAEAEAAVAEAQANAACLTAAEANRQALRSQKLLANHVGSEEQTDKIVTQAKSLKAQCEAALASVKTSQARVGVAKANLSRTRLIAPFDGVVAKIEGELNEYVTPSPIGIPTPPTVDLIENKCFYVSAPIDEVDASGVRIDMPARITLDAFKQRRFDGKVRRIAPYVLEVEKQARTVEIEVGFSHEEDIKELLAGYSADVEIVLDTRRDTLRIPSEAVVDGRKVFVFLFEEKIVREVGIQTGLSNWASTEVVSGLKEGQSVVVNVDRAGLKDGVSAILSEAKP